MSSKAAIIQKVVQHDRFPSQFQRLFPSADHEIRVSKRRMADGWKTVDEWTSRASLHDRYVIELRMAIEIAQDGMSSELESPSFYLSEVTEVWKNEKGNLAFRLGEGQPIAEGEWAKLVDSQGDFSALGMDLIKDQPVQDFAMYYLGTR